MVRTTIDGDGPDRAVLEADGAVVPGSATMAPGTGTGMNVEEHVVRLDGIASAAVPAGTRVVSIVGNCELGLGDGGTVQAASFKAVVLGS